MKFTLSNEKKKEMAQNALDSLEMQYYREIIMQGEDPETFVVPDESDVVVGIHADFYARIFELKRKMISIQNIIDLI